MEDICGNCPERRDTLSSELDDECCNCDKIIHMPEIRIVGASQRVQRNRDDKWEAWYECHKCGREFSYSGYNCRDEKCARDESDTIFEKHIQMFCWACGHKLTTKDEIPEESYIAILNRRIDELLKKLKEMRYEADALRDSINSEMEDDEHA